jgi:hypothetical protein
VIIKPTKGDWSDETNTAIPGSPRNGIGPHRNKNPAQMREKGVSNYETSHKSFSLWKSKNSR